LARPRAGSRPTGFATRCKVLKSDDISSITQILPMLPSLPRASQDGLKILLALI
jgi:hypothetical protein